MLFRTNANLCPLNIYYSLNKTIIISIFLYIFIAFKHERQSLAFSMWAFKSHQTQKWFETQSKRILSKSTRPANTFLEIQKTCSRIECPK